MGQIGIIVSGNQQHATDANHSMLYTIWIIPLLHKKQQQKNNIMLLYVTNVSIMCLQCAGNDPSKNLPISHW